MGTHYIGVYFQRVVQTESNGDYIKGDIMYAIAEADNLQVRMLVFEILLAFNLMFAMSLGMVLPIQKL